jgi:chromosome segregation ATPase
MLSMAPAALAQVDAINSLLALIADPAAAKQRLDELVKAQADAQTALAALVEAQQKSEKQAAELEAARLHDADLQITSARRVSQLNDWAATLTQKANALATEREAFDTMVVQTQASLQERTDAVKVSEQAVAALAEQTKAEAVEVAALKIEYEAKLVKIREMAA